MEMLDSELKKLLGMAAKAAGIEYEWRNNPDECGMPCMAHVHDGHFQSWWMPLDDDGDALRLAVALDISIRLCGDELTGIAHWFRGGKLNRVVGSYRTGHGPDVRLLIVRAAAQIGKSMP